MQFLFKLLLTWILNLLIGSLLLVIMYSVLNVNFGVYGSFFSLSSIKHFFGSVFQYFTVAGFLSFWLFLIIYFIHFLSKRMNRDSHQLIVKAYWIGVVVYTGLMVAEGQIYLHMIPFYLAVGILLFNKILKVKLWKFT